MPLPIPISRSSEHTLQEQIYHFIRNQILGGLYRTDFRLPSTRDLATGLKVSRNTVMLAYEWLTSEGYIETRTGSGTFVCRVISDEVSVERAPAIECGTEQAHPASNARHPAVVMRYETPVLINRTSRRPQIDFWYGRPDPRQFPIKTWRRLIIENLARAAGNFAEYGVQAGDLELRQAIAGHLATTRGLKADPDRILITAGAQDGLNVICRLLVKEGTKAIVENPGYAAAAALFRSYGAELAPAEVDADGVRPDAIERCGKDARLLYTTPSHQFPTGAILGLARRQMLLAWADAVGAYVVEDDYDSEVIYDRPPVAALAALDQNQRVIYLGSFSKTIGAGIRIGYLVLPEELVGPAVAVKSMSSYGQPWLDQAVLACFLREGGFRTHLRRIRTLYRARRDVLIASLGTYFGDGLKISGHDAGLHLVWTLRDDMPDADEVCDTARTVGVGWYTPARAGALELVAPTRPERRLVLGYAALTPNEIQTAVRRVAATLGRDSPRDLS